MGGGVHAVEVFFAGHGCENDALGGVGELEEIGGRWWGKEGGHCELFDVYVLYE